MPVKFYNQNSSFKLKNKKKYKSWIANTINSNNFKLDTISIIFCSKPEILHINNKFLNHNYYTDIITFPYTQGDVISADIFVCIPVIKENAKFFKQTFINEVNRVIIHGVLHLVGFNDINTEEREIMSLEEDKWIANLQEM